MDKTPVSQTTTDISEPVLPEKKSNTTVFLLLGIIVILLVVIASGAAYLLGTKNIKSTVEVPVISPTELPMPTTNLPTTELSPTALITSASPTLKITPSVKPTIAPNPDGNTFTSAKLGIAFYWANKTPADQSATVKTAEVGNKAYVYLSSGKQEDGQSIEKFSKSPTDTLTQAITKQFLSGIPVSDCFVRVNPTKPKPTITKATIGYPIPANADLPNWEYGEKCPAGYKETNGMAYFFEDSTYPDRFYYVSIGQYGIPAGNSNQNVSWQDTIVVQ